jgi:hypothetical protein
MIGINQVLKMCWEIVNKSRNINNDNGQTVTMTDNKTVLQALQISLSLWREQNILLLHIHFGSLSIKIWLCRLLIPRDSVND